MKARARSGCSCILLQEPGQGRLDVVKFSFQMHVIDRSLKVKIHTIFVPADNKPLALLDGETVKYPFWEWMPGEH